MPHSSICIAVALQRYVDIPPVAEHQRELVLALAGRWGSRIHVVSVNAPVALLPGLETTQEKLERYAVPLTAAGLQVSTEVREGRPSQEIRAALAEHRAELLVIGSHSKRGPLDIGLGSTAAALADLEVATLMVRPSPVDQERARELMIPRYPVVFPYGGGGP